MVRLGHESITKREVQWRWVWKLSIIRIEEDLREQIFQISYDPTCRNWMQIFAYHWMQILSYYWWGFCLSLHQGLANCAVCGPDLVHCLFYKTSELRMVFTFSNGCKETSTYFVMWKLYEIQISVFMNKVLDIATLIHFCIICGRGQATTTKLCSYDKTVWHAKSKLLAAWPFKVCQPLP